MEPRKTASFLFNNRHNRTAHIKNSSLHESKDEDILSIEPQ